METHQKEEILIDKEVQLNYIDKLHNGLIATGQVINRVAVALILLSLVMIALSVGIVTVNPVFSLVGLAFSISSWLIFLSGAWLIGIYYVYWLRLNNRESRLHAIVIGIYESAGIKLKDEEKAVWLLFPSISVVTMFAQEQGVNSLRVVRT
jgi:Na+(H+)/acetate symporter ActP